MSKKVVEKGIETVQTETDPRVVRTRSLLANAFNTLLDEVGFQQITVGEIASRAAVNRATFYLHFEDKYALFAYTTHVSFMDMVRRRIAPEAPYSRAQIDALVECLWNFIATLKRSCAHTLVTFESMVAGQLVEVIEEVLSQWVRQDAAVTMFSWGMYGMVSRWVMTGKTEVDSSLVEQVVSLVAPVLETADELQK